MKYGITAATGHFGQVAVKELVGLVGADNVVINFLFFILVVDIKATG